MTALAKITQAGFSLSLTDTGNLKVIPYSKLNDIQRDYLKAHKAGIIAELQAEAANDGRPIEFIAYPRIVTSWTPAGNPMAVLAKDSEHEAFLLMMNPRLPLRLV